VFEFGLSFLAFDGSNVLFGSVYGVFSDGDDVFVDELVVDENELGELGDAFIQALLFLNWIARHFTGSGRRMVVKDRG
jgi:hypothetical protein